MDNVFWASVFGAACGVAGMTALLGILSWAWRRAALWWIARKIRLNRLKVYPEGHGTAQPLAELIDSVYEGPSQVAGTVVEEPYPPPYPWPGVRTSIMLQGKEVAFVVPVSGMSPDICPCCRNPLIVAGGGGRPLNPPDADKPPRMPQDEPPPGGRPSGPTPLPPAVAGGS